MKKSFQVGQRVVVYDGGNRYMGTLTSDYTSGYAEGYVWVRGDGDETSSCVHVKQCRRLVKRKRREVWIKFFKNNEGVHTALKYPDKYADHEDYVRFIEAKGGL